MLDKNLKPWGHTEARGLLTCPFSEHTGRWQGRNRRCGAEGSVARVRAEGTGGLLRTGAWAGGFVLRGSRTWVTCALGAPHTSGAELSSDGGSAFRRDPGLLKRTWLQTFLPVKPCSRVRDPWNRCQDRCREPTTKTPCLSPASVRQGALGRRMKNLRGLQRCTRGQETYSLTLNLSFVRSQLDGPSAVDQRESRVCMWSPWDFPGRGPQSRLGVTWVGGRLAG